MNPIEQKLRSVIAEHGLKDTYTTFQSLLKGDYEYLQSLFSQTISELHSSASPSQSSPPLTQKEHEEPKKRGRGRPPKQTANEEEEMTSTPSSSLPNKKTVVHVTKEAASEAQILEMMKNSENQTKEDTEKSTEQKEQEQKDQKEQEQKAAKRRQIIAAQKARSRKN